ncbi:hypothetical protein HanRHA438_Chr03g0126191 [Helianthus annuus]|nr:hypothetical protein HanRHA438_Chr03g0126191 [Helianthus annuus]
MITKAVLQNNNLKSKIPFFVPEFWPVLRLSSKGLFFLIWIQRFEFHFHPARYLHPLFLR